MTWSIHQKSDKERAIAVMDRYRDTIIVLDMIRAHTNWMTQETLVKAIGRNWTDKSDRRYVRRIIRRLEICGFVEVAENVGRQLQNLVRAIQRRKRG